MCILVPKRYQNVPVKRYRSKWQLLYLLFFSEGDSVQILRYQSGTVILCLWFNGGLDQRSPISVVQIPTHWLASHGLGIIPHSADYHDNRETVSALEVSAVTWQTRSLLLKNRAVYAASTHSIWQMACFCFWCTAQLLRHFCFPIWL